MAVEIRGGDVPAEVIAERVLYAALRKGVSFKVTMGSILTLSPALTIGEAELDAALKTLESAIVEASAE